MNSEGDAKCRAKGAPGSPAHVDCRKALGEADAQKAVIQEQKRFRSGARQRHRRIDETF